MLGKIRTLFGASPRAPLPAIPAGQRAYAVGDIHGRADLFEALIEGIEADDAAREAALSTVVLLGDLVDRGPESARVIALARAWQAHRTVRILTGNHEEMFLEAFDNLEILKAFLRYGGKETLLSYPIDRTEYDQATLKEARDLMRAAVPQADRDFLGTFEDAVALGDYLFVHAGIRPGVALDEQSLSDLRWIREPFLSHAESHGAVVVHGHTITKQAETKSNRIGIDTGAYASGRLTALGLEGTARWLITVQAADDAITVTTKELP